MTKVWQGLLIEVAERLNNDMKIRRLANKLETPQHFVDACFQDYPSSIRSVAYAILNEWKDKQVFPRAALKNLALALREADLAIVAVEVLNFNFENANNL